MDENKMLEFIDNKDFDGLKRTLAQSEEMEILHAFIDLDSKQQVTIFRLLSKDGALSLFEQLDTEHQHNLLRSFTDEKSVEYINELAPDDRVRLLDEMPATVAKKLVTMLSPKERELTNTLLGYKAQTAGRIMTTEFISLKKEGTVDAAIERVRRQAKDKETIYTLFVTDNFKKLEGVLSLKDLLIAEGDMIIEELMSKKVIKVTTDTDQEEVAKTLQELDLLAIPVVDNENRLVGIVTVDDAMDILEEETTEDILAQAGFAQTPDDGDTSDVLINGKLLGIWRVRLPFLIFAVVAAMLSGFVIDGFEETLQSIAAIAIYIPLIMTMGGNVGTQSSTVFVRGVATGQIEVKRFARYFFKEIYIGLSLGIVIGILSGIVAWVWQGDYMLGFVVGLSLLVTMTFSALLGFLVPFLLMKFKLDQAAGSTPILTALKDILGLIIYFVLVSALLGHMING